MSIRSGLRARPHSRRTGVNLLSAALMSRCCRLPASTTPRQNLTIRPTQLIFQIQYSSLIKRKTYLLVFSEHGAFQCLNSTLSSILDFGHLLISWLSGGSRSQLVDENPEMTSCSRLPGFIDSCLFIYLVFTYFCYSGMRLGQSRKGRSRNCAAGGERNTENLKKEKREVAATHRGAFNTAQIIIARPLGEHRCAKQPPPTTTTSPEDDLKSTFHLANSTQK